MIYPAKNFLFMFLVLLGIAGWGIAQEISGVDAATAIEKNLIDVIARAEKSVVAIARVRRESSGETFRMELRPDAFDRRPILSAVPRPTDPDFIPNEYGTGVVVDSRGLILTAYHVLGEDSDYYVTTSDRKVYKAVPKAADPRSDLAVLAIEAADLVPITLGNAAELKKGQIVVSLGNPYAIARDGQASAAWGIVSNLARKAPVSPGQSDPAGKTTLQHFGTLIQTDAKLNLGTSGGPLLNLQGEMVGLSVALAAAAGYETAAGYAIPVDQTFRRVVETLKQGREVEYGFLGVQPANLAAGEVLKGMHGIRVAQTIPGTPAVKYGLKTDDIITAVDDTPIHDADSFVLNVGKLPVDASRASGRDPRRASAQRRGQADKVRSAGQKNHHRARSALARPARGISIGDDERRTSDNGPLAVCRRRRDRVRSGREQPRSQSRLATGHDHHPRRAHSSKHSKGIPRRGRKSIRPGRLAYC